MHDQTEESVEIRAVGLAEDYYEKQGWKVKNVSRARGEHSGYDLLLVKASEQLRVEVKGSEKDLEGIPDLYHTEIDPKSHQLIADQLCVVYFRTGQIPRIAIIPREALLPEHVIPKLGYRISGKFKNKKSISSFLVAVDQMYK